MVEFSKGDKELQDNKCAQGNKITSDEASRVLDVMLSKIKSSKVKLPDLLCSRGKLSQRYALKAETQLNEFPPGRRV